MLTTNSSILNNLDSAHQHLVGKQVKVDQLNCQHHCESINISTAKLLLHSLTFTDQFNIIDATLHCRTHPHTSLPSTVHCTFMSSAATLLLKTGYIDLYICSLKTN